MKSEERREKVSAEPTDLNIYYAPQRNSWGETAIHAFMQFMPTGNSLKNGKALPSRF